MFSSENSSTCRCVCSTVAAFDVMCFDGFLGLAAEIRYYIIAGDDNEDFHVDQFSGKLSVSRGLDYERVNSYKLTVQVRSGKVVFAEQ